jgi:PAS domain S-box-containing protein
MDEAPQVPERLGPIEGARKTDEARATSAQLRAVVENIDEGIVVVDRDGVVVTINQAAREMIASEPEARGGMHASQFREWLEMFDLNGRPLPSDDRPMSRVLRGESFSDYEVRCRQTRTGREWIGSFVGTAVLDGAGKLRLGVLSGRDVTERFQAAQQKDVFLATLGHELRNPLASILAAAQMLMRELPPDGRGARWAGIIDRQADHLSRLVDDLLDVARITGGRITLHCEPLDLGRLVIEVLDAQRPLFVSRQLELESAQPARALWVDGDRTRIAQILDNLLSNAAKFTSPGGRVSVEVGEDDGHARMVVRDTGIGIEREVLDTLFEPFRQGRQDIGRSTGGLGLGMTLVKGLTELHGGRVSAYSAGPGSGAEFAVSLPISPPPVGGAQGRVRRDTTRHRVLVIEDNRDVAEVLAAALADLDQEVVVAGNGRQGLELARSWKPDLVLCDIGLPGGIDGFDIARELGGQRDPPRLVAITGYGSREDRARSREAGFERHLTKPVSVSQLAELLRRAD